MGSASPGFEPCVAYGLVRLDGRVQRSQSIAAPKAAERSSSDQGATAGEARARHATDEQRGDHEWASRSQHSQHRQRSASATKRTPGKFGWATGGIERDKVD